MITHRQIIIIMTQEDNNYHRNHHSDHDPFTGEAGQEQDPGFLVQGHLAKTDWIITVLGFAINYNN